MKLLRIALVLMLCLGLLVGAAVAGLWFVLFAPISTVGEVDFEQRLTIPPLAESRVAADGTRVFELTAQVGTTELLPGKPTDSWGFNGPYLGPTLRAEHGDDVRVKVTNALDESTTVHWHGMHLPAKADGGPHQPIRPVRRGRRRGRSTSQRQPCGTTRTPTVQPRNTSTEASPGCSSSTTQTARWLTSSRTSTASTTCR
jgi:FtsP/CotA-like multicopper oxidase with cupredoxin domain